MTKTDIGEVRPAYSALAVSALLLGFAAALSLMMGYLSNILLIYGRRA